MTFTTRISQAALGVITLLAAGRTAVAQMPGKMDGKMPAKMPAHAMKMNKMEMARMMASWPMASRDAAMFMSNKYGPPAAMTNEMAMWGKTGPWKRTIVYAVEHPHEFPAHHTDVMQQWVDYRTPMGKFDDLAVYDGSVVLERTAGEISARCDKEAANFLALNLADEIIQGKRTVSSARQMYGAQIMALKAMQPAPYTERIMFATMMNTGDPDHPASADTAMGSHP